MAIPTLLEEGSTVELREHCTRRHQRLIEARRAWLDYSRLVAEELLPNRLPFLLEEHSQQRGGERNTHIVDAVGHLALETVAAGISSGTMPVSTPWFELTIRSLFDDDYDLRLYLEESQSRLREMHNQSNANHVLPECQKEWVAFGTAAVMVVEDDEKDYRLDPMTAGEYCIAEDYRGRVDTCYRKLTLTVGQLADEFGVERLSDSSRQAYDDQEYDALVDCVHAIEPDRDGLNPYGRSDDMPWRSVYYEEASDSSEVLAVRGYNRFPALVWRWGKLPGTAYGYGRGHEVLPHLVRLRRMIYRYGQALAFKTDPPVQIPAGMQQHEVRGLPGGRTSVFGQGEIKNLFRVDLQLTELDQQIERTRQDIRDTLGASLVASLRRISHQMTAREADLRTSQDLTEFLPGLFRQTDEFLNPYIEWIWQIADERGRLPPQPDLLDEQVIDIEFTSPLVRKQRQGESDAIVRTYAIAGEMANIRPDIVDNLEPDEALRTIAEIEGAPAGTLAPIEKVRELRAARERQQMAEAQAAAAQQGVQLARDASQIAAGPAAVA